MLHNPLYIGLIRHKKDPYPGEHPSILDRDIWEKVQTLLESEQPIDTPQLGKQTGG